MRKQHSKKWQLSQHKNQGFSLFIVIVIMIITALLVVGGARWTQSEMRSSSNTADRQLALSLADSAIRQAETRLIDKLNQDGTNGKGNFVKDESFVKGCNTGDLAGFCLPNKAPATLDIWEQEEIFAKKSSKSSEYGVGQTAARNPRYIIEWMGDPADKNNENENTYRITARAWGQNENTQVTVQVYDQVN